MPASQKDFGIKASIGVGFEGQQDNQSEIVINQDYINVRDLKGMSASLDHDVCTPSVYFNFDDSIRKSDHSRDLSIPYDSTPMNAPLEYSQTNCKDSPRLAYLTKDNEIQLGFCELPLQPARLIKAKIGDSSTGKKVDTQQFFDEFDNHFIVKFGDSPVRFDQPLRSRKSQQNQEEDSEKKQQQSKIGSYISEPLQRELYKTRDEPENEEVGSPSEPSSVPGPKKTIGGKQNAGERHLRVNKSTKSDKVCMQIRKRVLFKNHENLACKRTLDKGKERQQIINSENLMIITSGGWSGSTGFPQVKKEKDVKSQPIKSQDKTVKKESNTIFSRNHQMFRQTLRSTTLDNWRKKFTCHKTWKGGKFEAQPLDRPIFRRML